MELTTFIEKTLQIIFYVTIIVSSEIIILLSIRQDYGLLRSDVM
jgi:hypothetical protein